MFYPLFEDTITLTRHETCAREKVYTENMLSSFFKKMFYFFRYSAERRFRIDQPPCSGEGDAPFENPRGGFRHLKLSDTSFQC